MENLVKGKPHYKGRYKLTKVQRKCLASAVRCTIIMRSKEVNTKKVDTKKAAKLCITRRHIKRCTTLFWKPP